MEDLRAQLHDGVYFATHSLLRIEAVPSDQPSMNIIHIYEEGLRCKECVTIYWYSIARKCST